MGVGKVEAALEAAYVSAYFGTGQVVLKSQAPDLAGTAAGLFEVEVGGIGEVKDSPSALVTT